MERPPISGFTLIELFQIVLVIIGLIVGGVLVGQDLINAAEVRAQIAQIEKYNGAVHTFQTKYNQYLPGDIPEPDATIIGLTPRGIQPGEGDGNEILQGYDPGYNITSGVIQCGETSMFWNDLGVANLIVAPSRVNVEPCMYGITGSNISWYLPPAKIRSLYIYIINNGPNYYVLSPIDEFGDSADGAIVETDSAGLSVVEAYNIDTKMDDGVPTTGTVTEGRAAFWVVNDGEVTDSPTSCYNTTTNTYSMSQDHGSGRNCSLMFRFQ